MENIFQSFVKFIHICMWFSVRSCVCVYACVYMCGVIVFLHMRIGIHFRNPLIISGHCLTPRLNLSRWPTPALSIRINCQLIGRLFNRSCEQLILCLLSICARRLTWLHICATRSPTIFELFSARHRICSVIFDNNRCFVVWYIANLLIRILIFRPFSLFQNERRQSPN